MAAAVLCKLKLFNLALNVTLRWSISEQVWKLNRKCQKKTIFGVRTFKKQNRGANVLTKIILNRHLSEKLGISIWHQRPFNLRSLQTTRDQFTSLQTFGFDPEVTPKGFPKQVIYEIYGDSIQTWASSFLFLFLFLTCSSCLSREVTSRATHFVTSSFRHFFTFSLFHLFASSLSHFVFSSLTTHSSHIRINPSKKHVTLDISIPVSRQVRCTCARAGLVPSISVFRDFETHFFLRKSLKFSNAPQQ